MDRFEKRTGQDIRNNNYFAGWPLHLKVLPWYKWRFTWIEKTLRDMAGCLYDKVIVEDDYIPQCTSLFDDWDVIQWFINKNIRYEIPVIGNSENLVIPLMTLILPKWINKNLVNIKTSGNLCR